MLKILFPHPAALIKTTQTEAIVIADPHIGWELALQEKGIHLPSQTSKLLEKLKTLLVKYQPKSLIIVGDVKHTVVAREPAEWREVAGFFNEIGKYVPEISVVRGNHDGNLESMLPAGVKIHHAAGVVVGDMGLFHGHKWPSPSLLGCRTLVMGHMHPTIVFHDTAGSKFNKQIWVKAAIDPEAFAKILLKKHNVKVEGTLAKALRLHYKVKPRVERIFVMPSFNPLLGGRPINEPKPTRELSDEKLVGPVLRSDTVNLEKAELYLLDGTYLGNYGAIKNMNFQFHNHGFSTK